MTTRLAIDHLRSARVRREQYAGEWLPDNVLCLGDAAEHPVGNREQQRAQVLVRYSDGGGKAPALPRPFFGRDRVAKLLFGLIRIRRKLELTVRRTEINGQPGAMFFDGSGLLVGTWTLEIADGLVQTIRSVANPEKLRQLGPPADLRALLHHGERRARKRT